MAKPTDERDIIYSDSVCYLLEERMNRDIIASCVLDSIISLKNMLHQFGSRFCDNKFEQFKEIELNSEDTFVKLAVETGSICKLANLVQLKFSHYNETQQKEKTELQHCISSLTQENKDIGRLLKIAVMEKEAMERKSRSTTGENKRGAIMQIAEKGLQKVGFGFVMGVLSGDPQPDMDGSDGEEGIVSLAETVENIMKDLRSENNNLRRALQESKASNEQLQGLLDAQTEKLKENETYIKDLKEKETVISYTVEEMNKEMAIAKEDITRWREACELEVEAGKSAIKECENEIVLLKNELEQIKKSLEESNKKAQLKERLADKAMAAQSAAETCLRLADIRSASLRDRIEELTKQLEEKEKEEERSKGQGTYKRVRYLCWPWRGVRIPDEAIRVASWRIVGNQRSVSEMEALLRLRI